MLDQSSITLSIANDGPLYIANAPWGEWKITFLWKGGSVIVVIDGRRNSHWEIAIKKAIIQIKFILPGLLGICRMDLKLFRQSNLIHIINRIQITHIERNEFLSLPLTSLSIRKIKLFNILSCNRKCILMENIHFILNLIYSIDEVCHKT